MTYFSNDKSMTSLKYFCRHLTAGNTNMILTLSHQRNHQLDDFYGEIPTSQLRIYSNFNFNVTHVLLSIHLYRILK